MVGITGQATDGIINLLASTEPYNRVRCIPSGLGARCKDISMGGCWSVVETTYHINYWELLAAFLALKTFASQHQGYSTAENGQHLCSHICQPEGWHSLNTTVQSSPGNLGMVLAKDRYYCRQKAPARPTQCSGGFGVQITIGLVRLDAQPSSVSTNSPLITPTTHRSLCLLSDKIVTPLLQLETRSRSNSSGCLYTKLGAGKGLCQSTMVPDTTMFNPDKETAGQSGAYHTIMAIPTLVSSPAGNAGRQPPLTSHGAGHNSEPHQPGIHNEAGSSNTGRMAHIRKSLVS